MRIRRRPTGRVLILFSANALHSEVRILRKRFATTNACNGLGQLGHGNELRDKALTILTVVTQLSSLRSFWRLG